MKQPTEQQLKDPKWWDENDPTGGEATHFVEDDGLRYAAWRKKNEHGVWVFWLYGGDTGWGYVGNSRPVTIERPRPTPWQGPQDGLPPVGTECEYYKNDEWRKGVIFGHRKHRNGAVDIFIDFGSEWDYTSDLPRFRPIQSERDKLLAMAVEVCQSSFKVEAIEDISRMLYDAGMLVDPERKPMKHAEAHDIINDQLERSGEILKCSTRMKIIDALGYKD